MSNTYLLFASAALVTLGAFLGTRNRRWLLVSVAGTVSLIFLWLTNGSEQIWQANLFIGGLLILSTVGPISQRAKILAQQGEKQRSSRWGIAAGIITLISSALMLPWPISQLG